MADVSAPGLQLSATAELVGEVVFGADVMVGPGAILGKAPVVSARSSTAGAVDGPLVLGDGTRIGASAIVFAGTRLGAGVIVGDQAFIRERTVIGAGSVIGQGSSVDNDTTVGERVRIQSRVYVTAFMTIEDDVFVGPGAIMTNDDAMGRPAAHIGLHGPTLRRACRIGGGAVLVPGVEIGEDAFVAAGAVVTADVPARAIVMGVPARVVGHVPDDQLLR